MLTTRNYFYRTERLFNAENPYSTRKSQEIVVFPGFSDLVTRTGLEYVGRNANILIYHVFAGLLAFSLAFVWKKAVRAAVWEARSDSERWV